MFFFRKPGSHFSFKDKSRFWLHNRNARNSELWVGILATNLTTVIENVLCSILNSSARMMSYLGMPSST